MPNHRVRLFACSLALFSTACFAGLADPPDHGGSRETLTLTPTEEELHCDSDLHDNVPAAHLLEEDVECDRATEHYCFALAAPLREVAAAADPIEALGRAAAAFDAGDVAMANALADLAVTGRRSALAFESDPPNAGDLSTGSPDGRERALRRAYEVAWALRGPASHRASARADLGWVAVSPEDDLPDRPVNIPGAAFPQTDLDVSVPLGDGSTRSVRTRVVIASTIATSEIAAPEQLVGRVPERSAVVIPEGGDVLLFVHGHSSLAEEGAGLAQALVAEYQARGEDVTIVAMDLPSNAYAERVDPDEVIAAYGSADDALLLFQEDFLAALVTTLDLSDRIEAVLGGSLGGNLVLRLAERSDLPWVRRAAVWSPASIDYSWARAELLFADPEEEFVDIVKHEAVRQTRDASTEAETTLARRDYFAGGLMSLSTQADYWYRSDWQPCRDRMVAEGLVQIGEVYDARFRRWHYRVAYEQLVFSHIEPAPGEESPRFSAITAPLLLVTGSEDDSVPMMTWTFVNRLAPHLTMPGRTLFLESTGHAMHSERPELLASEIATFLFE